MTKEKDGLSCVMQKGIKELFNQLPTESYVCHWHKLDIIMYYCDWHPKQNRIQDFVYEIPISGRKCQIENCPCDAEIRLVKKNTIDGKPMMEDKDIVN